MTQVATNETLFQSYEARPSSFDEFKSHDGVVRPKWLHIREHFGKLGPSGIGDAMAETERLVRESGANFRAVQGDRQGIRPWRLNVVPLVLNESVWRGLESGLKQRVRVLEGVLADLLGEQRLLRERIIPAELLCANPSFARAFHELPSLKPRLDLTATDLARDRDGSWWVTGDRTRAPSGLGYALENRVIISRVFPNLIRNSNVIRLASFFASLQNHFNSLAAQRRDNPRVAILTPGEDSYRHTEDAYLARYLGYTLVQGRDLAVRGSRLNVKTLGGLLPIEVLWRHVSDRKCDALELDPMELQGTPGMLQAIRAGHVAVANSVGSMIAEMPALLPFLPAASKFLFGEPLKLPSIATYWCGGAKERAYVLENLDKLILRPAFAISGDPPITPSEMSAEQRQSLAEHIKAKPFKYVAQMRPSRSTTPVWENGQMQSWYSSLRTFQLQTTSDVHVLPGGLARVTPDPATLEHSPTSGRLGQDCWIVSDGPVDQATSLLSVATTSIELTRGGAELPSRVAENLYWLGRSAERTEAIARLLRGTLIRMTGESSVESTPELLHMVKALAALGQVDATYAIDEFRGNVPAMETVIPQSIFDTESGSGLRAGIIDMSDKASAVHDRISLDAYRIISKVGEHLYQLDHAQSKDLGTVIIQLDRVITDLQALAGLASESMTRTHAWRFLQLGRRIERAAQTAELLSATLNEPAADERSTLEALLQVTDSFMTYRSRYLLQMRPLAVIDLLVNDVSNPRSIAFQLQDVEQLLSQLPGDNRKLGLGTDEKLAQGLSHVVRMSDPAELAVIGDSGRREALATLMDLLIEGLPKTSDAIAARYLIHTNATQQLTQRTTDDLPGVHQP
ncbi:circularly permuted type 2 ATP-grasp protein [Rubripirellula amarantea]|nr:circularly permuted type 2 ATP-grasp protein [Rubripirellula amarantea]